MMIDYFESLDRAIVLTVNGWHTPFLDEVMWWLSARVTWIPLYLLLLFLAYRAKGLKTALFFLVFVVVTIIIADVVSVYLIKETIGRYRPSHHALLTDRLHFYRISAQDFYKGGQYGFVSSHATNFFAIATAFCLVFRKTYPKTVYTVYFLAALVCFSRIYLGVHYLSDIIGGALLGSVIAWGMFKLVWKRVA
ncbi:MAG: phosphatase PAP2 family protein [Bacteroidota bacterium]